MNSDYGTEQGLLDLWIRTHGKMKVSLHNQFKNRAELQELVHYDDKILVEAFSHSPKLIEILRAARRLDPNVRQELNRARAKEQPGRARISRRQAEPNPTDVLPLPGDPGATRRPGKKRDRYRVGNEAELRHIARRHKWWD